MCAGPVGDLRDLYERVPRLDCGRLCGHACGPIVVAECEWLPIAERAGARESGEDLVCPYYERASGLCGVYDVRPLICRLWGTVESLRRPHGCEPERWLTSAEADALLEEAVRRSGGRVHSVWRGWDRYLAESAQGASAAGSSMSTRCGDAEGSPAL